MSLQLQENIVSDGIIVCQVETDARALGVEFIYRITLQRQCEFKDLWSGNSTNLVEIFILTCTSQESETFKNSVDQCCVTHQRRK